MIPCEYLSVIEKSLLFNENKIPLAYAHDHARDEIINRYHTLPTDRVLVENCMALSQKQFNFVVRALRLLCEYEYKGDTDRFCDLHHYVPSIEGNTGIEVNVYHDGYPALYGFEDDDPVVCVACYYHDEQADETNWSYPIACFVVHKDFFRPVTLTSEANKRSDNGGQNAKV